MKIHQKINALFGLSFAILFLLSPFLLQADNTISPNSTPLPALVKSTLSPATDYDFFTMRNQIRIVGFLMLVSLIPFGIMMMTSFTRISIIFQFLKQALGSAQVPSNQIIIGLSLILTGFIMHPVIKQIQDNAITPYFNGQFRNSPAVVSHERSEEGELLEAAWDPLRNFLLSHTREKDLQLFLEIGHIKLETVDVGGATEYNFKSIPWYCLIPSFIMSELRTAFMMGFLLFLPFMIIDMVVSSILMSMGMMMLPPILISMPFKLLLFILIDGWRLIIQQIINGFHTIG